MSALGRRYHAASAGLGLLGAATLLVALLAAPDAKAQSCDQDGSKVTCEGNVPDGFVAAQDGLTVRVKKDAQVGNGGNAGRGALDLGLGNEVTIDKGGRLLATGADSAGVQLGDPPLNGPANSVVNRGTIEVDGNDAAGVRGEGDFRDVGVAPYVDVENRGTIQATGNGAVGMDLGDGTSVTNAGTITAPAGGVRAGNQSPVVNEKNGVITVTGPDAVAIQTGNRPTSVINAGTIIVDTGADRGVGMLTGTFIGVETLLGRGVRNQGSLELRATDSVGFSGGEGATFVNEGTVEASGLRAIGAVAGGGANVSNTARITASGSDAVGVVLAPEAAAANDGEIRATGAGAAAVHLSGQPADADSARSFTNLATLAAEPGAAAVVTSDATGAPTDGLGNIVARRTLINDVSGEILGGPSVPAFLGGAGDDGFTNAGLVRGDVLLGGGDDQLSLDPRGTFEGAVDGQGGSDTIQLLPSSEDGLFDTGSFPGFERLTVPARQANDGIWTLTSSQPFPGDLDFGIAATAALEGVVSATGDLSTQSSTLRFDLGLPGESDRIELAGEASLAGNFFTGSTVLQLTPIRAIQDSASYTLIDAAGGVTISGLAQTAVDGVFLDGQPTVTPTRVEVTLTRVLAYQDAAAKGARNQYRTGGHLDRALADGVSADLSSVMAAIDASSLPAAQKALNRLHGEIFDAHTSAAISLGETWAGMLAGRPLPCEIVVDPYRPDVQSLSPCGDRGVTPWARTYGKFGSRDGNSGFADWEYKGGGLAMGADYRVDQRLLLSGVVGAGRLAMDFDGRGDGSLTNVDVGLAAGYRLGDAWLRAAFDYGHDWYTTHRQISFPGFSRLATSDHEGDRITILGELGYELQAGPILIEPVAAVEYTWIHQESFDESSAGDAALDVDSREDGLVATELGVEASHTWTKSVYLSDWLEWADGVWRPRVGARWRQVWNDWDRNIDARLKGAPASAGEFRTSAQDAQYGAALLAEVSFQPQDWQSTFHLGYESFVGDDTVVHDVALWLKVPF